jgi:hypothetical protein
MRDGDNRFLLTGFVAPSDVQSTHKLSSFTLNSTNRFPFVSEMGQWRTVPSSRVNPILLMSAMRTSALR